MRNPINPRNNFPFSNMTNPYSVEHRDAFFDNTSGSFGYGNKYGELSYNGRPLFECTSPVESWIRPLPLFDPLKPPGIRIFYQKERRKGTGFK